MSNTEKKKMSKTDKKTSPQRMYSSLIVIVLSFATVGYALVDEFELLDTDTSAGNEIITPNNDALGLTSSKPNNSQKKVSATQVTQQEIDVPLLSVQSHDELSNLHLLAKRVRAEEEDAATLFGLQRISIHAKRQQAKEVSLMMQINSDKFVAEKARVDTDNYVKNGGLDKSDKTSKSERNPPSESEYFDDSSMKDNNKNSFGMEITPVKDLINFTDLRLKALSNHRAYITVKSEPFKNVKAGQTFAGRFSLIEVNHQSECVRVKDSRFEELDTNEYAVICLN